MNASSKRLLGTGGLKDNVYTETETKDEQTITRIFLSKEKEMDRDLKLARAMLLVNEWIAENGSPHTTVIINHEGIKVVDDTLFIPAANVQQVINPKGKAIENGTKRCRDYLK